jgi:phage terminase large subunit
LSDPATEAAAKFPDKLACLFDPARYKVLYGGRGGAKTWGIARALLIMGASRPLRVLCAREIQKSLDESSYQVLKDQIGALGLSEFYEIQKTQIIGRNGTFFIFAGLRHNVNSIKSKEGLDVVWVDEAQTVSKTSWDTLVPTIRKDGSEIWVSFNPVLETDETYKRFVLSPPPGAAVVKVNWSDNPWFPATLDDERRHLQAKDPDAYLTVYEGHCRQTLDGAIYANEIRDATAANRITKVEHVGGKPVHTYWDLGKSDLTAIWFAQVMGLGEFRLIDYYENCGKDVPHYVKVLQGKPYIYGDDWLPHDAFAARLGQDKTIAAQFRALGRNVREVPSIGIANGINAARTLFGNCWFDQERCADGLNGLRHYRYKVDEKTGQRSKEPFHDWASNPADAFRYFAVATKEPHKATERRRRAVGGGWMGH